MDKIIKKTLKSKPEVLSGSSYGSLFCRDLDMGILNYIDYEEVKKLFDSAKPKISAKSGNIIVFGTGGCFRTVKESFKQINMVFKGKMYAIKNNNIYRVGWHDKVMRVEFNGGKMYSYTPISKDTYDAFWKAKNRGSFLHANIIKGVGVECAKVVGDDK